MQRKTQLRTCDTRDPELETEYTGPRTLDLGSRTRARVKNQDQGTEICEQGLVFILHTVWTFIERMIFVLWKYSLEINTVVLVRKS